MKSILQSLKQPSAWRGLIWMLASAGIQLYPDQVSAIMGLGAAAAGAVGTFVKD